MYRLSLLTLTLGTWSLIPGIGWSQNKDQPKALAPAMAELIKGSSEAFIKHFDKNKDGFLTKSELPPRFAGQFDYWDMNGDGKLDKKEVDEMLFVLRRRFGFEAATANRPEVERMIQNLLTQMDTNKDGKISKQEARGRLAENFDQLDTNKDGFLDKQELRPVAVRMLANQGGGPGRGNQPTPATEKPRPDFDALDRDADGRLTRDELRGTVWADLFDQIDTNKDGKIDRKEFEAYLKKEAEKN
jgi:Ca2+-binding EF-hand superfamily protein